MYSIGSSIVRMCSYRSELILSSIAASVVDLPLPVGPVTSTRPRGRSASVDSTGGRPSSPTVRIFSEINKNGPHRAALGEDVAAEAREAADPEREVELHRLFEALFLRIGEDAVDEILGFRRRELGLLES